LTSTTQIIDIAYLNFYSTTEIVNVNNSN